MFDTYLDSDLQKIIQEASWIAAIVGGSIAAYVGITQLKLSTEQQRYDLRWKQANAAKELVDDIHLNRWADQAVSILDESECTHSLKITKKKSVEISYEATVIPALEKHQFERSEVDRHIVRCFDWFFYFINRIEHYIRIKLIEFEDVRDIFSIYHQKIIQHKDVYINFMQTYSYRLAIDFWKHYEKDDTKETR